MRYVIPRLGGYSNDPFAANSPLLRSSARPNIAARTGEEFRVIRIALARDEYWKLEREDFPGIRAQSSIDGFRARIELDLATMTRLLEAPFRVSIHF